MGNGPRRRQGGSGQNNLAVIPAHGIPNSHQPPYATHPAPHHAMPWVMPPMFHYPNPNPMGMYSITQMRHSSPVLLIQTKPDTRSRMPYKRRWRHPQIKRLSTFLPSNSGSGTVTTIKADPAQFSSRHLVRPLRGRGSSALTNLKGLVSMSRRL